MPAGVVDEHDSHNNTCRSARDVDQSAAQVPRVATGKTLVIGLGNPLITDDSVGLRIAARLERPAGRTPACGSYGRLLGRASINGANDRIRCCNRSRCHMHRSHTGHHSSPDRGYGQHPEKRFRARRELTNRSSVWSESGRALATQRKRSSGGRGS